MKMNQIITKKDEIRLITSDPKEMLGKYLVNHLTRNWFEDFIDEDTGEVVSIERKEIIKEAGTLINKDMISEILFFLQSGDILNVEVSNQCRQAYFQNYSGLIPWSVNVLIRNKKYRFLLYADSMNMALEVVKDYVELNYIGSFYIIQIKEFNNCILIDSDFLKKYDNNEEDKKYYQIDVNITYDEMTSNKTFIVYSSDVDTSMEIIRDWTYNQLKENNQNNDKIIVVETAIEKVNTIPCDNIIDKDFSQAYLENGL